MAAIPSIGARPAPTITPAPLGTERSADNGVSFSDALKKGIESIEGDLKSADAAVENFAAGKGMGIPEVIIALERSDVSLKFMSQVRNKVLDAYNEVMRMPV